MSALSKLTDFFDEILNLQAFPRPAMEPIQSPIQWVLGVLTVGVKWLGHEANHSPLSSAKVMNV